MTRPEPVGTADRPRRGRLFALNPARGLQRRLMAAFALFAICLAALFSLYALSFAYVVEDRFLGESLLREAERQRAHYLRGGEWLAPEDPNTLVLFDIAQFPEDLRSGFRRQPQRREFRGADGRHYHLHAFQLDGRSAWLVAEVGERLIFRQMRAKVIAILGGSAASALGLALAIGWWIARRTTLPLSRLADAVGSLRPDQLPEQHWLRHATAGTRDEVDVLARGLDDLVQRVRAFIQREQEFTRDVSHELRTPLAVIRNLSEQLAADAGLSTRARAQLESIRQSADQLEQTVTALLSLAREAHRAQPEAPIALLPVLERVIVEQAGLHADPALELQVDVSADVRVGLSQSVLHILLSNLIGNAFAHAACADSVEQGRRRIGIEVRRSRLCIRNSSDAAPTGEDFAVFHKREGSAGFGLGLAIVRRLCDRFDIDLRIDHANGFTTASFPVIDNAQDA